MEKINRYVQLVISIVLIAFGLFGSFTKCRRKAPCFSYGDIRRYG